MFLFIFYFIVYLVVFNNLGLFNVYDFYCLFSFYDFYLGRRLAKEYRK